MQRPGARGAALAAAAALLLLAACSSAPEQMKCATQDGSISISVLQMERQGTRLPWTDLPTSKFFVLLPEAGEYRIEIRAAHFRGSFDVTESPGSGA